MSVLTGSDSTSTNPFQLRLSTVIFLSREGVASTLTMLDSFDSKYVFTAPLLLGREDSVILNGVILGSLFSSKQNNVTTLIKKVGGEKLDKP